MVVPVHFVDEDKSLCGVHSDKSVCAVSNPKNLI